jgi:murein DD-endopeptidase MepM/ murein hydrolase activator NlpD
MYADSTRANFAPEKGFRPFDHFHPAIDLGAPEGTPIVASEAGKVVFAGRQVDGNLKIQVQIRPGVSYSSNHCARLLVRLGANVTRGQKIATVGHSGNADGNHNHFWVGIDAIVEGFLRHSYHDPTLFLPGGSRANSPLILPPGTARFVQVNGPGINIRSKPTMTLDSVYATTDAAGIMRNGVVIAPLDKEMGFGGWENGDGAVWARARLGVRTVHP